MPKPKISLNRAQQIDMLKSALAKSTVFVDTDGTRSDPGNEKRRAIWSISPAPG
jgi:hypothetical protein